MLRWDHMLCHGLTKHYVTYKLRLQVDGFLMWTVGCNVKLPRNAEFRTVDFLKKRTSDM